MSYVTRHEHEESGSATLYNPVERRTLANALAEVSHQKRLQAALNDYHARGLHKRKSVMASYREYQEVLFGLNRPEPIRVNNKRKCGTIAA